MARQKIDKNVVYIYIHYNIIYFDYIRYKYNELYSLGAHICNINLNVMSEN